MYATDKAFHPKVFRIEEFLEFQENNQNQCIAGILESLVLRLDERHTADFGFPFIFNSLILPCNGLLAIHSGNVLLEVDTHFLEEFFVVNDNRVVNYDKAKLKSIVTNRKVKEGLLNSGALRVFDYSFPGAHMAVTIDEGNK